MPSRSCRAFANRMARALAGRGVISESLAGLLWQSFSTLKSANVRPHSLGGLLGPEIHAAASAKFARRHQLNLDAAIGTSSSSPFSKSKDEPCYASWDVAWDRMVWFGKQ
jgi:hypothetical protein